MRQVDTIRYAPPKDTLRSGNWMISYKGNRIFPLDMRPEDIDVEEIAHSLSNICRFGGHCKEFYSVAQHSVMVCDLLPIEFKLCGLLHDATEAYCGDMVRPLKKSLPQFERIETNIWTQIALKFDLPMYLPKEVQIEDARVLLMEKRDILTHHEHEWEFPQCAFPDLTISDYVVSPTDPKTAKTLFLNRFHEVWNR